MNILSLENYDNKLVSERGLEWGVDIKWDRSIKVLSKNEKPTEKWARLKRRHFPSMPERMRSTLVPGRALEAEYTSVNLEAGKEWLKGRAGSPLSQTLCTHQRPSCYASGPSKPQGFPHQTWCLNQRQALGVLPEATPLSSVPLPRLFLWPGMPHHPHLSSPGPDSVTLPQGCPGRCPCHPTTCLCVRWVEVLWMYLGIDVHSCLCVCVYVCQFFTHRRNNIFQTVPQHSLPLKSLMLSFLLLLFN